MVELVRRVIQRDIVGGQIQKLRKVDNFIHIFSELSATIGAFVSTALIIRLGNNYSFLITPGLCIAAGVCWLFISLGENREISDGQSYVKVIFIVRTYI